MFFSVQPVMVRYLSDTIPATEQVFFRGLIVVLLFLPWSLRNGPAALRTRRLPLIGVRSVFIAKQALEIEFEQRGDTRRSWPSPRASKDPVEGLFKQPFLQERRTSNTQLSKLTCDRAPSHPYTHDLEHVVWTGQDLTGE